MAYTLVDILVSMEQSLSQRSPAAPQCHMMTQWSLAFSIDLGHQKYQTSVGTAQCSTRMTSGHDATTGSDDTVGLICTHWCLVPLGPLELESLAIVNCRVGARNQAWC